MRIKYAWNRWNCTLGLGFRTHEVMNFFSNVRLTVFANVIEKKTADETNAWHRTSYQLVRGTRPPKVDSKQRHIWRERFAIVTNRVCISSPVLRPHLFDFYPSDLPAINITRRAYQSWIEFIVFRPQSRCPLLFVKIWPDRRHRRINNKFFATTTTIFSIILK